MGEQGNVSGETRRGVLGWVFAVGGMGAAYGTLAAFFARFVYPARPTPTGWLYVSSAASVEPGAALTYYLPSGSPVSITRQGSTGAVEDFVALSSTCPHLGCQVHWEPQNDRFFCPCHNGVFTPDGVAIGGPPGDAGMSLPQYPLKVEDGLLYIEVPLTTADAGAGRDRTPLVQLGRLQRRDSISSAERT